MKRLNEFQSFGDPMSIPLEGIVRLSKVSYHLAGWSFLFLLLGFPLAGTAAQAGDTVRLQDNSDWWSENRSLDSDESIKTQEREFSKTNFQVLGVNLGEAMFSRAAAKLGKATTIERGDASTGRRQACYVSLGTHDKVHLIFEQGEVEYAFYLFADGPAWEGANRCVASKAVSHSLATASGLHLGQTRAQVIAILGKPTKRSKNELVYSFSVKKKTSLENLKEAKQRHPEMSEKDFQENYAYYSLGAGVHAKFVGSKLTYLAVSRVESN
jgi:hypothetical protein